MTPDHTTPQSPPPPAQRTYHESFWAPAAGGPAPSKTFIISKSISQPAPRPAETPPRAADLSGKFLGPMARRPQKLS